MGPGLGVPKERGADRRHASSPPFSGIIILHAGICVVLAGNAENLLDNRRQVLTADVRGITIAV
ncbi:hypothetical protein [Streptomyces flavidovirens]|uniref:Uncharacterized protein n=1 Tax=Streptomyces flavidovirens TaxID=67298 RepID=A0ABW6RR49_9ACTN